VIDVRGREVVKGAYDLVGRLEAGFREVRTAKGRGVLDRRGAVVVPPELCRVRRVSADLFLVQRASPCAPKAASRGQWGVVDGQGRQVLPFTFDHVVGEAWGTTHTREPTESLPPVWLSQGCQWTKDGCRGGTWRRLDLAGKRLGPATSDGPGRWAMNNPLSPIRRNGRYGLVDARGVEIAPPRYASVTLAPGGYAVVTSPP
jgi:hypothetical protein